MFINIRDRVNDSEVKQLLEYSVYADTDELEKAMIAYQTNEQYQLFALTDDDGIIGIIGFTLQDRQLAIRHIAIHPHDRGLGYGRGLLLELIEMKQQDMDVITAEVDEEAVNFYRSIGFSVHSLGEVYPGMERFICEYEVDQED